MKSIFNILNKKILYNGFFKLHEIIVEHKKHDGSWSAPIKRELFSGAHVATVLPYDPLTKKIILIDQFRPGILKKNHDPIIKEIVAGIIDKGESPEEAAKRECKEEIDCDISAIPWNGSVSSGMNPLFINLSGGTITTMPPGNSFKLAEPIGVSVQ